MRKRVLVFRTMADWKDGTQGQVCWCTLALSPRSLLNLDIYIDICLSDSTAICM